MRSSRGGSLQRLGASKRLLLLTRNRRSTTAQPPAGTSASSRRCRTLSCGRARLCLRSSPRSGRTDLRPPLSLSSSAADGRASGLRRHLSAGRGRRRTAGCEAHCVRLLFRRPLHKCLRLQSPKTQAAMRLQVRGLSYNRVAAVRDAASVRTGSTAVERRASPQGCPRASPRQWALVPHPTPSLPVSSPSLRLAPPTGVCSVLGTVSPHDPHAWSCSQLIFFDLLGLRFEARKLLGQRR
jgi:hypothetical protein